MAASLTITRARYDAQAAGVVLYALTDAAYRRGDLDDAARFVEESIALLRTAGDELALGLSLTNRGAIALARGDSPTATAAYQEALELGLGVDADWVVASSLAGFAAVAAERGDHATAAQLLGAAETVREASHQQRLANSAHHAQTMDAVRCAHGEAAFTAAWGAGRALSSAEAADLLRELGLLQVRKVGASCPSQAAAAS